MTEHYALSEELGVVESRLESLESKFTQIIQRLDQILKSMPTNGYSSPLLQTIREISVYCRRSQSCIRRWIREEGFPAHKAFKKYQVSTQQIDAWRTAQALVRKDYATRRK